MTERARTLAEWHEDHGPVLWWRFPIEEPPYVGTPLDRGHTVELHTQDSPTPRIATRTSIGGWPGYHTHWTPLPPLPIPPDAPCSCGKPYDYAGPCGVGGCPLGLDA